MSTKENYEKRTEELLLPIAEHYGVRVYDVDYGKEGSEWYLRIFIDKDEGVTIQDCEAVSRRMSEILDAEDFIDSAYIFEVSSPGLGRTLKKDRHLQYSLLQDVEVKTYVPIGGTKEFRGKLISFDKDKIVVDEMVFERSAIASIRLALDF